MAIPCRSRTAIAAGLSLLVAGVLPSPATKVEAAGGRGMVRIPAGSYAPLYSLPTTTAASAVPAGPRPSSARPRVAVGAFLMDVHPTTNAEFLEFVRANPAWRRSRVEPLFADAAYLVHWRGDLELGDRAPAAGPVVYVSWFAARAYLAWRGKRLPTVDEWEYVAAASETARDASGDAAFLARVRQSYGRPSSLPLPPVAGSIPNAYGVGGMHDLVREWVEDFNSALVTGESRADGSLDRSLFCGSGSIGAADFRDYAAFMRFAFRASLDARYGLAHLGFRGAMSERGGR